MEHLRTLSLLADRYRYNSNLISDLTATYQWLNARTDDCRPYLVAYEGERLFLNVDNPSITWNFAAANQLVFNGRDEGGRQRVRSFLLAFKPLLLAAGGREVTDVVRPALELSDAEEVLLKWRSALNQHRLDRQLTDVVLESSDGQQFHAHRLVLSMETETFKGKFSGRWASDSMAFDVNGHILERVLGGSFCRYGSMNTGCTHFFLSRLHIYEENSLRRR